jgi:DNA-binding NarL/FixJ family response regulator
MDTDQPVADSVEVVNDASDMLISSAPSTTEKTTLTIFEPDEVVRLGLQSLFARVTNFQLLAQSGDISTGIAQLVELRPDIVVTELIGLPIADFEWIRRLRLNSIRTRILVFTTSAEETHVTSALTEGASAYILKRSDSGILVRAINAAVGGDLVIDAAVKETILRRLSAVPPPNRTEVLKELTWREASILALLAEGCPDREIASRVRLSAKTVRNYVSQILGKLGVNTRTQAAIYAIRNGLTLQIPDRWTGNETVCRGSPSMASVGHDSPKRYLE